MKIYTLKYEPYSNTSKYEEHELEYFLYTQLCEDKDLKKTLLALVVTKLAEAGIIDVEQEYFGYNMPHMYKEPPVES